MSTEADELITRLGRIQEDNEGSLVAARADRWVDMGMGLQTFFEHVSVLNSQSVCSSTLSLRFVLSQVFLFLYSLGPSCHLTGVMLHWTQISW